MSRGPIFIESRLDEGGGSCNEIAAVALQVLKNALNFVRGAAIAEGKAENPECRASLGELNSYSRSKSSLRELSSTASTIFGVKQTKMLRILAEFEADGDGAYDKALREVRRSNPGSTEGPRVSGPLPSCYFDPSNIVTKSGYTMGAPFYDLILNDSTWYVARWMGYVANLRDSRYSPLASNLDYQIHLKWFEATVTDALIRLPNEGNQAGVWEVLESIGLLFSDTMKEAIIKQMKGDSSEFIALKHEPRNKGFDRRICYDAKKRWADQWAEHFAEELNNTDQGIVSYGKNTLEDPIFRGFRAGSSKVERWIQQNTIYGFHRKKNQYLGPHGDFMEVLEKYCRRSWYRDINMALQRFRQSARGSREGTSQLPSANHVSHSQITSLNRAGTCYLDLESELKNLGFRFTEPVKTLIFKSLTEDGDDSFTALQQHAFRINRARVVQHAASQIKAALRGVTDRKRPHD